MDDATLVPTSSNTGMARVRFVFTGEVDIPANSQWSPPAGVTFMTNERQSTTPRTNPTLLEAIFDQSRNPRILADLITTEVSNAPSLPFVSSAIASNIEIKPNRSLSFVMHITTDVGEFDTAIDISNRINAEIQE